MERKPAKPVPALILTGILLAAVLTTAQTPTTGPIASFTATTANVSGANDSIRIDVLRWSTDAERDQLLAAWTQPGAAAAGGRGAGGRRGPAPLDDSDPALADVNPAPAAGGRGAGGRGGRGGGAGAADAPKPTPEGSLTAALGRASTVGYLWSSEVAGYALHYAVRLPAPDASERIVLITDRRLGATNDLWKPTGADAASTYQFSVIELHLNSKGEGEGKVSLTGKVTADTAAKIMALENYSAVPVILKNVKRKAN